MMALAFGLFGLIVGSFLNVLIIRHGVRTLGGRSACMACGRQLLWYDMVPVFSWLALRGKCRVCKARISVQYPLVEALNGILFALVGALVPFSLFYKALFCIIMALLLAITVYDLRHTIIPDAWVYTFDALAFFTMPFFFAASVPQGLAVWPFFLAGPFAALPLFALWFVSSGRWMGLGDVKLAFGIGWLLGPSAGIIAIFLAFIIGALISVCVLLPLPYIVRALHSFGITSLDKRGGGFTMRSEIPFGPFLILSCIIVWLSLLYGIDPLASIGLSL